MENNTNTNTNTNTGTGTGTENENNGTQGQGQGQGQAEEAKTYTAEEVAKLIQAEADRRTNQALAKQKKEYEKKLSLSSLDEQQRKEAEAQMKIEELQSQLAAFQIEKNRSELKSVLSTRGLSAEFADILNIGDDIEAAQANIDKLDKLFKAAVKAEVEKRLAGNTPKGNAPVLLKLLKKPPRRCLWRNLTNLQGKILSCLQNYLTKGAISHG